MPDDADASRLRGSVPTPLALLTPVASAAVTQTGCRDQSQAAVSLVALFCGMKSLSCRTTQRAIGRLHNITSTEATLCEWQGDFGWGIPGGGCRGLFHRRGRGLFHCRKSGSRLSRTDRFRFPLMSQLQAQVPGPLANTLPGFLSASAVAAPTIGLLFAIFLGKRRFKRTTMPIPCVLFTLFVPLSHLIVTEQ